MSIRFLCALLLALLVAGCDTGMMDPPDAARLRDAAVVDGGGLLDAGPMVFDDAGPAADAGAADAGPPLCVIGVCDPRSADGCTEGSCVLWGADATCEPEAGAGGPGSTCEAVGDCAAGLACFRRPGGGVCGRICCPDDGSACIDGAICGGSGVLVDGSETSWGRCLPRRTCDLLEPAEACEAREGCYIVDAGGTTECRVAGSGGSGEACEMQEDCRAGFFCGGIGAAKRCVRICRIGAEDCPTEEGRCVAQAHTPEGIGLCSLDSSSARWNG
ncbi:MAG TPA: hypothetical protein RMH99_17540 [Sandaracinaceae bacterium LLY-WYZ-13_1]|nr:hypothetical protein [Sandaracinaceae bacterium LLY-WYZ-13_1]